jgi:hypothetical protein
MRTLIYFNHRTARGSSRSRCAERETAKSLLTRWLRRRVKGSGDKQVTSRKGTENQ